MKAAREMEKKKLRGGEVNGGVSDLTWIRVDSYKSLRPVVKKSD